MLNITKKADEAGYHFYIYNGKLTFWIFFAGNLDLYFNIFDERSLRTKPTDPKYKTFNITKENYFLYSLFEDLFSDIQNGTLYNQIADWDWNRCETAEERQNLIKKREEQIKRLKKIATDTGLVSNGIIKWKSDDYPDYAAPVLMIKKLENEFLLTFEKSTPTEYFHEFTYSIRFRNSGSRYNPFNLAFMKMYNRLVDYNPEYHQIHIEEYLYQQKLKKKII